MTPVASGPLPEDGIHCLDPDGTLLGKLLLPEVTSNLVFGGVKRNHLFVAATTSVYSLRCSVNGAIPVWATKRRDAPRRQLTSRRAPVVTS